MTLAHATGGKAKTDPSRDKVKRDPPLVRLRHRRYLAISLVDQQPREDQKSKGESAKPARHDVGILSVARADGADQAIDIELISLHRWLQPQFLKRLRRNRPDAREANRLELLAIIRPKQRSEIPRSAATGERDPVHLAGVQSFEKRRRQGGCSPRFIHR